MDYGQEAAYYYLYGLLLARENRCAEALSIAQALIANVPADDSAVANAEVMILICEDLAINPPTATPLPEATPTPEATVEDGNTDNS